MLVGAASGEAGFRRLDVRISPAPYGGLRVELDVPGQLGPALGALLAALGMKAGKPL